PDFRAPAPPTTNSYTAVPLPKMTTATAVPGGAAQRFAFAQELSDQWWTLFRSPELDKLIKQGLKQSPSLAAAKAALNVARENLLAAGGSLLYPRVDAGLRVTRQRISGATFGGSSSEFDLFNASLNVSYTLDLFGASRYQLEGLRAQVDYQRFQYEAAYLTLTANLVTTAIREASLRGQIAASRDILADEQQQFALVQRQFELGAVPRTSVLSQQSQLALTRATLPPLEKQLAFTRHALAALAGRLPGEGGLPSFRLATLQLPEELPVSLPSALVRQRPDIRASEALLHRAGTAVGVATANLYPQITLTGSYGVESSAAGDLFTGQKLIWNLGAGLLQPLFHGGELSAKRRAAGAAYNQAAAHYRQTVLLAFQNVADVLRALAVDAQALRAQADVEAAAKATLELTQKQFELGAVSYLSPLVARRDYQQARIGLIVARGQRYADTAALFQALGGGWWQRPTPTSRTAATLKAE
ncbi:MAG: efflux transporter outer membrane subunit, partial [Deltaproteobacteria bacterium]|nr:efflux transporter outer membrane subunit [Deltaproteobacteria bacterium]